ncbi:hypothetical protein [Luteimonas salinilitoris]|uniref:Asparagine synthetase domain-containing protein n=1 Tax=Luteimonas salinilitoris TaxID=3237697 RepID=A0ABV4HTU5_9GAMM
MYLPDDTSGFILASSWTTASRRNQFSGICYTDSAIIIGSWGYERYSQQTPHNVRDLAEGRFSVIRFDGNRLEARVDALGQDILYYFHQGDAWAVSNSFLALARHLVQQGVRLTADYATLRLPLITHSMAQQLLSNDTGIQEIRVLPADRYLRIQLDRPAVRPEVLPCGDLSNEGFVGRDEYVETLIRFVARSASRSAAIVRHFGDRACFDITGGQDSRLVLALLAASGIELSELNFLSNRRYEEDYKVASALGEVLGFQVRNKQVRLAGTTAETAYEMWKLGNLGVYYPVYAARGQVPQHAVHFHGACGECYRDYYGATAATLVKNINRQYPGQALAAAYADKMAKAFAELGQDTDAPDSMMIHYRHFRSRFHFGRSAFRNLNSLLVTPLASPDLIHATRHLSREAMTDSQLALDLLLLACPELATLPFDTHDKAFKDERFAQSPFRRGRPEIAPFLRDFDVFCGPAPTWEDSTSASKQESFRDILLNDLLDKAEAAQGTGLFPANAATKAASKIVSGKRFTADAKIAAHIISVGEIATLVAGGAEPPRQAPRRPLKVQAWRVGSLVKAYASLADASALGNDVEYAFYLKANHERQATRWYSKQRSVEFELDGNTDAGNLQVQGFVRATRDPNKKLSTIVAVTTLD